MRTTTVQFPARDPSSAPTIAALENPIPIEVQYTGQGNWVLTVIANGDLVSGADTIPIANIRWTATGAAYLGKADKALAFARAQIGRPCVWGATGPESYDCSSLTQAAWRAAGVTLPRAAIDQAKAFTRVGLDELRPGDLVFFHDDLSHVGLCTDGATMIHAPGPGARIREEPILAVGEGTVRGAVRPA